MSSPLIWFPVFWPMSADISPVTTICITLWRDSWSAGSRVALWLRYQLCGSTSHLHWCGPCCFGIDAASFPADRASVICDGTPDKTIDLLLRLHGYPRVDREEFLKQAIDLNAFVNDSKSNKLMELMLTQDETHPRLATRAYECYEWSRSECYQNIVSGSYTAIPKSEAMDKSEVISAELTVAPPSHASDLDAINAALKKVNVELERYINQADRIDYALAISSGICCGLLDSLFVGEFSMDEAGQWGSETINRFILKVAKARAMAGTRWLVRSNIWKMHFLFRQTRRLHSLAAASNIICGIFPITRHPWD